MGNFKFPDKMGKFYTSVLPLVYDESLTYYQQLGMFQNKINEIIDSLEQMEDAWEAYTDEQIAILKEWTQGELDNLRGYIDQNVAELDAKIDAVSDGLQNDYNQKIDALEENLNNRIDSEVFDLNARITQVANEIYAYIDTELQKIYNDIENQLVSIRVRNPVTGAIDTVQGAIDSLFGLHRNDALTAAEYDALQLTCTAYEAYSITAFQYDTAGKTLLV